ncbi:ABC transporter substrate-binding protein [Sesbania bispinosa]|nr:ABC transporter substrate-binding protein [Sesbania bispinosa]
MAHLYNRRVMWRSGQRVGLQLAGDAFNPQFSIFFPLSWHDMHDPQSRVKPSSTGLSRDNDVSTSLMSFPN